MPKAALLQSDRWDKSMIMCLLGSLRMTARPGFRTDRIDLPQLAKNCRRHDFDSSPINCAPHYEAYLWVYYLWAYRHTGSELVFTRAESAIRETMKAYLNRRQRTVSMPSDERRMFLPLVWSVRVKVTPKHRGWLRRVADDLVKPQDPSGALREKLATIGRTDLAPTRSNEDCDKNKAMLLQKNDDPVCDMLPSK